MRRLFLRRLPGRRPAALLVGDGIRLERQTGVSPSVSPKFSEFVNEVNLTLTRGAWGISRGVTLIGSFNNSPTSTHLGLVNNTGTSGAGLAQLANYCLGEVQAGACSGIARPSGSGSVIIGATSGATQACAKTAEIMPVIVFGDVTLNGVVSTVYYRAPIQQRSVCLLWLRRDYRGRNCFIQRVRLTAS